MPGITIPVSDRPVEEKLCKWLDVRPSVEGALRYPIEAIALSDPQLVCCNDAHPFAQAAHDAFYKHYPLVISPDDIWFCIAQGFAQHVNLNAERLRHKFVSHAGKKTLVVSRPDFNLGKPNPWPEVFTSFSQQIGENVGEELRSLIVADFSTTTDFHRAATEVALMDALQPYFEYEMLCGCGIPSIALTGAPDDWRNIRRRAAALAQYGLDEWVGALDPILDQLEASSRGYHDHSFWNSFFRYESGSGGTAMTGWILILFPYLKDDYGRSSKLVPNKYLKTWQCDLNHAISMAKVPWREREETNGPSLLEIPAGLSSAPVRVEDLGTGQTHDMRFVAGMFGVSQDQLTKRLSASFGWAIVYEKLLPVPTPRRGWRSLFRNT